MTADLSALIARLEAAEVGGRELDWDVGDALDLTGDEEKLWFTNPVTQSIDAALALAERVLPGWYVGVQPWFHTDPDRVMSRAYLIRPDWKRWNPVGDDWCDQHHGLSCATPALAVAASILRAKQGESA